ncbi:CDP-diacylglycerol--glycerol-3-phosphate 3-phosphatidyltransferase [Tolypothrix sp. PCC 7601]|nr:CDP-diacylglycerol--glycerol-3-phosphate 3-phosphatidyltransferase [Tolypothrix sp. PCC 7601]
MSANIFPGLIDAFSHCLAIIFSLDIYYTDFSLYLCYGGFFLPLFPFPFCP